MTWIPVDVKMIPPAPPKTGLSFDQWQFNRRKNVVTKDNGIAFSDAERMRVKTVGRTCGQMAQPAWAKSDRNIQLVVAHMMWNMLKCKSSIGFPREKFEENPLALALELEEQLRKRCIDFQRQRDQVQMAGILGQKKNKTFGYAKLLSKVIYDSFRLGKKSNEIAADLSPLVTAVGVRQHRSRAQMVARVIFPAELNPPYNKRMGELYKHDVEYKRQRFLAGVGSKVSEGRTRPGSHPTAIETFQLIQAGRTVVDLAEEYGACIGRIRSLVRAGRRQALGNQRPRATFPLINVLKLWKEGCTAEEISQDSGLTLAYVVCLLQNRWGVDVTVPRPEGSCDIDAETCSLKR